MFHYCAIVCMDGVEVLTALLRTVSVPVPVSAVDQDPGVGEGQLSRQGGDGPQPRGHVEP